MIENLTIIIMNISNSYYLPLVVSYLLTFSLVLFYLDDWKLSKVNIIRYFQIFSFISALIFIFLFAYNKAMFPYIISYVKDSNDVHLHGHVSIDKETGKAIGQGMSQGLNTIGSQLGLGATMVGVSTAVGKAVTKSGMPPLQKAGFIVGSGLVAGIGHSLISSANRDAIRAENVTTSPVSNIGSGINKLVDDSHISPLQELLFNGEMMNYTCLAILYLLIIQLVFKLYFKENINLNLSKLLGNNTNTKLEFYFNKIIKLNKQMSIIWIWFGFVTIMFGLSVEGYAAYKVLININNFSNGHLSFNPTIISENIYIPSKPIQDILFNLNVSNYIAIITLFLLMLQIILKFHYNNNINSIYIWLTLLILMLTLSYAAYTYGDLYAHIDGYVKMYINYRLRDNENSGNYEN